MEGMEHAGYWVGWVWKEERGPVRVTVRAKVHFLPRPCTPRCSLRCRRSPILLSRWPALPGLKPPSWVTRYLGYHVGLGRLNPVPAGADSRPHLLPQVSQMAQYFEPLTLAAVGAASKTLSHPQQMALLDQTKTLAESALQLLYTAKEAGGNPKVLSWGAAAAEGEAGTPSPCPTSLTLPHSKQLTPRKPWRRLCR